MHFIPSPRCGICLIPFIFPSSVSIQNPTYAISSMYAKWDSHACSNTYAPSGIPTRTPFWVPANSSLKVYVTGVRHGSANWVISNVNTDETFYTAYINIYIYTLIFYYYFLPTETKKLFFKN